MGKFLRIEEVWGEVREGDFIADGWLLSFFFFQAEDGIRDWSVTGVQTCALPICNKKWAV